MLQKLGLSKKEELVYLTLQQRGNSTPKDIAEKTSIKKSTVYDILSRLDKQGYIFTVIKNKKKFFRASPLEIFKEKLEAKQEKLKIQERHLGKILEKLTNRKNRNDDFQIQYFHGKESVSLLLKDITETIKRGYFTIGSARGFESLISEKEALLKFTAKRRQKGKTKTYIISDKHQLMEKLFWEMDTDFREVRFLPKDTNLTGALYVYGDKVAWIGYGKTDTNFIIKNPDLAEILKLMHAHLWHSLKNKNLPKPKNEWQRQLLKEYKKYKSTYPL